MPRNYGGGGIQYASVGGSMADALTELLTQREVKKRQEMIDAEVKAEKQRQAAQQKAELALRQAQEDRIRQDSQRNHDDLEKEREYRRAQNLAASILPGESDEDTANTLTRHGFTGIVRKRPGLTVDMPDAVEGMGGLLGEPEAAPRTTSAHQIAPAAFTSAGGSSYQSARAAAAERAAQAKTAQEAAAERAAADRASREQTAREGNETRAAIAAAAASARAGSQDAANTLRAIQAEAAKDKLDTARTERERTATAAQTQTTSALDTVRQLQTHKGIGAATGAYELRGFTQDAQDFNALREQLVAQLALPNLGALKGPMSDKDVVFVKNIATTLGNPRMSEKLTREALAKAQQFLASKLAEQGGKAPGGNTAGGNNLGKDW